MTNELIFLVTGILDCCFVLLARQLGKTWLHMSIVLNLLLISTLGAKLITLFGFTTNAGNVFYACVFLAAHMLTEHYGAKEAYRAAWIGFIALFFYLLMAQFTLRLEPIPAAEGFSTAFRTIFDVIPRISFASLAAYLVAQHLNIWAFDALRRKTAGRMLWLRDTAANAVGQLVDSLLFFTAAFYGVLPHDELFVAIGTGFLAKMAIGAIGTGFMYMSRGPRGPVAYAPAP